MGGNTSWLEPAAVLTGSRCFSLHFALAQVCLRQGDVISFLGKVIKDLECVSNARATNCEPAGAKAALGDADTRCMFCFALMPSRGFSC